MVTLWYRQDTKTKKYKFNHVVEGVELTEKPQPRGNFPAQNSWKNSNWESIVAILENNKIKVINGKENE